MIGALVVKSISHGSRRSRSSVAGLAHHGEAIGGQIGDDEVIREQMVMRPEMRQSHRHAINSDEDLFLPHGA